MDHRIATEKAREYVLHFGSATRDAAYRAYMDGYAAGHGGATAEAVSSMEQVLQPLRDALVYGGPERRTGSRSFKEGE